MKVSHTKEIWKWAVMYIKGKRISFKGYYKVSNRGNVKSVGRYSPHYRGRMWTPEKILKPTEKAKAKVHNYLHVTLYKEGKSFEGIIHILVLNTFVGPCPSGMQCRHLDGNNQNNNLENICWGTPKENGEDKVKHGTAFNCHKGESHYNSKLSNAERKLLRNLWKENRGKRNLPKELADQFGITRRHVYKIVQKK